ncbi:uncharacterized protein LOC8037310 [Ixodes scapularis]|uniref:uncharacterized protein LOC8037310 n=1 Tax=Ixodes scapularis TaxID=6945 RepID=UPI001AA001A4|nr:uncharacterized protein LOC8037310 [Ixodes scapularis]
MEEEARDHSYSFALGCGDHSNEGIQHNPAASCTHPKVNLSNLLRCVYEVLKTNKSASELPEMVALRNEHDQVISFCQENFCNIVLDGAVLFDRYLTRELGKDIRAAYYYGLVFVRCRDFEDAVYVTFIKNNQLMIRYLVSYKRGLPCTFADVLNNKLEKLSIIDSCKLVSVTVDRDCFHCNEIDAILHSKKDRVNDFLEFHCVIYKLESMLGYALQKSMVDDPHVSIIANLCNMLKNLALADDLNLGDVMFHGSECSTYTFFNYKTLDTIHNHWLDIVTKLNKILVDSLVEDDRQVISFILETLKSTTFIVNLAFYLELFRCLHDWTRKVVNLGIPTYQVINELEGVSCTIRHHTSTGGSKVEEVREELQLDIGRYKGVPIKCDLDEAVLVSTMERVCGLMSDILDDIVQRSSRTIKTLSILDSKTWPVDTCDLDAFGFDSVKMLAREYQHSLLENIDVFQEWGSYKRTVLNSFVRDLRENFDAIAPRMVSSFRGLYPGIVTLLSSVSLLCPASKVLQAQSQSLLEGDQTEELMTIRVNGPPPGSLSVAAVGLDLLEEHGIERKAGVSDSSADCLLPLDVVRKIFNSA